MGPAITATPWLGALPEGIVPGVPCRRRRRRCHTVICLPMPQQACWRRCLIGQSISTATDVKAALQTPSPYRLLASDAAASLPAPPSHLPSTSVSADAYLLPKVNDKHQAQLGERFG